jgi:hypothetical protein
VGIELISQWNFIRKIAFYGPISQGNPARRLKDFKTNFSGFYDSFSWNLFSWLNGHPTPAEQNTSKYFPCCFPSEIP